MLLLTHCRTTRTGLLTGFSLVALALAGLSAAISGWSVFVLYPRFLLHLRAQPFAGVVPQAMANFRGLTYLVFHSDQSSGAVISLWIVCTAALLITLKGWNKIGRNQQHESDLVFANTVLFALLVSYHLNPHDLSLLLLPIAIPLHSAFARAPGVRNPVTSITVGLLGILFLPPLHVWALRAGLYSLVSLPLLALFLSLAILPQQGESRPANYRPIK